MGYGEQLVLRQVEQCEKFVPDNPELAINFSIGMRLGMLIAMRHPEWAQAFHGAAPAVDTGPADENIVDRFVESVPVEAIQ